MYGGGDPERQQFFEHARSQAKREYELDSNNLKALVRWGGALLELSHFEQGEASYIMIVEAILKLEEANERDAGSTDALWCLGNAYTSLGFLCPEKQAALTEFLKAAAAFQRCAEREPGNKTYQRALEMCGKAPDYYDEIRAHIELEAEESAGAAAAAASRAAADGVDPASLWWDFGGWALLGVVVAVAAVATWRISAMARPSNP